MKLILLMVIAMSSAQSAHAFDGSPWHVSTGNLSVGFISNSPIGAHPQPGYAMEAPPSVESLIEMKKKGLVAFEDYIAWGAIEREKGKWDWRQHDAMCDSVKKAGLQYVVYNWTHLPPTWLLDGKDATLTRCVDHHTDARYFSIYDPRTIDRYDHYYKALAEHFGDRIDGVYACILGPYGEGNYPLNASAWVVNLGHCHDEGYWCADPYALAALRDAMRTKYGDIAKLNAAWGTNLKSFSEIDPPKEIVPGAKITPSLFPTPHDRRRWLDFITWYHQAIIDFAERSIQATLKYWPKEKVRTKPGGNAGGVNPISWGTYCPGYAKVAAKYGIVLQPADCHGACFGDKWVGAAYQFYGVTLSTEPAGGLDHKTFVRRMFSDASCGASQIFTYEFDAHAEDIQSYAHLFTGKPGDTDVAVLCPTTFYRLGGDLGPVIRAADRLRDVTDFDVLDELLVLDGALTKRHKTLVMMCADYVDQPVLDKIEAWVRAGGSLVVIGSVRNVEGAPWSPTGSIARLDAFPKDGAELDILRRAMPDHIASDAAFDGVWSTRRGSQTMILNKSDNDIKRKVTIDGKPREITIPAWSIAEVK